MHALLDKLDPEIKSKIETSVSKWDMFCTKVEERLTEIFEEADQGITEIMQINPHDTEPLFAAFKMVESRFLKIARKMRDAIERLEETWEDSISELDEDKQDSNEDTFDELLEQMLKRGRALDDGLELKKDLWQIKKQAEWARLLKPLVEKEKHHKIACTGCGSDLELALLHTMSNNPCPYCAVVNTLTPPPATLKYYSQGIEFLANESAIDTYKAMLEAEEKYNHRSKANTKTAYKDAIENYWMHYYKEIHALYPAHPQLAEGLDTAVERKVKHATFAM